MEISIWLCHETEPLTFWPFSWYAARWCFIGRIELFVIFVNYSSALSQVDVRLWQMLISNREFLAEILRRFQNIVNDFLTSFVRMAIEFEYCCVAMASRGVIFNAELLWDFVILRIWDDLLVNCYLIPTSVLHGDLS